jgi:hypothetical protein
MSNKAKLNWAMDTVIAAAFALSALSGIVMLLTPGGYQGGRNPNYGATTLFLSRAAWDGLHVWTSLVLVAGLTLHVALHWKWIVCMLRGTLHSKHTSTECPTTVEQVA